MSHEPLTTQLVVEQLQKLLAAFPRNLGAQNPGMMADVYRNGLRGLDGEAVRAAVDVAIQHDSFFPKVARLRELSSEWTRRNRATFELQHKASWDVCGVCGARVELRAGEAQDRDEKGNLLWAGTDPETGPIPKMIPTPARYTITHIPAAHGIRRDLSEAAD